MKSLGLSIPLVCLLVIVSPAAADISYTPTLHSELQAVWDDGTTAWSGGPNISLIGVIINDAADMSDYSTYSPYVWWQTYIQAAPAGEYGGYTVAPGDYGGAALYMRAAIPWGSSPYTIYDATEWATELDRVTNGYSLQYGDVVLVEAQAPGMFYNGKFNINEQHNAEPAKDFNITVIGRVAPTATPVTLADLKNPDDSFIFDETRATGCERYQASLVRLDNLLLEDAAAWALDGTVVVKQGDLTFDMKLGLDDALMSIDAASLETTPFSIAAILDQEDDSYEYTGGYRLWLTNASGLTVVPEPGTLVLLAAAGLALLLLRRRRGASC
ncbi:MAG: PEP-CTERM sorting domain-containing protein [Pirellulaceae bacterium]|nr:PEP-CTERM sorting domain-containing protein [Pirellulaceae bacterium]